MDSKVITIILTIILIAAQAYFDKKRKAKREQSKMSNIDDSSENIEDDDSFHFNQKYEDFEDDSQEEMKSVELKLESLFEKEKRYVHVTDREPIIEEKKPIEKKIEYQSIDMRQRELNTEMDAVYSSSEISSFVQSNYEQQESPISDLNIKPRENFFKQGIDPKMMIIYSEINKPKFLD